jgi:type IV pilus assembly protein PilM
MTLFRSLAKFLKDPPPGYAFELSEAGIAVAQVAKSPRISFLELEPDVLSVSPLRDNVLRPEVLLAQVRAVALPNGNRKRRGAALILPDYSVRVSVLDFDAFPSDAHEQRSLVRFRLKKSLPFDVDSAAMSYYPQASPGGRKNVDVVVGVAPLEIVARYEAPFRTAGFQPGWVTTSTLAALELVPPGGLKILAKRSGHTLSIAVEADGVLKLFRSIELSDAMPDEIIGHLFPTLAYVEDQLGARPDTLLLCGFDSFGAEIHELFQGELGVATQALRSRFGEPGEFSAGLLGYLESVKEL